MSTLHKFKAYFGMVPLADYEDEYLDEPDTRHSSRGSYSDEDERGGREYVKPAFVSSRLDDEEEFSRYESPRSAPTLAPLAGRSGRPTVVSASRTSTRGSLAMDTRSEPRLDTRRAAPVTDDGGPLSKITTLRPRDYSEARTIGERFRDGTPVIMDLVEMSNADAKRLVDFAAGLAFALRGSFDKVATKVFLLSPADVDVSPQERRRIAETGFYSQS